VVATWFQVLPSGQQDGVGVADDVGMGERDGVAVRVFGGVFVIVGVTLKLGVGVAVTEGVTVLATVDVGVEVAVRVGVTVGVPLEAPQARQAWGAKTSTSPREARGAYKFPFLSVPIPKTVPDPLA
jgi:hypothetical protein